MESIQAKRRKNKKKIALLSGIGTLTVIGSTLAYFTTSDNIINNFKSLKYQTTIKEEFESPDSWVPGDTVDMNVRVTNNGDIPLAARIRYEEKWTNANKENMSLYDFNGNQAAIINFNNSDWIKNEDGYYYYGSKENKAAISPNEISSNFINSVTFNENIKASLSQTSTDNGKTIIYESNGFGYDNATYTLTIYIDTIQYSASNIW